MWSWIVCLLQCQFNYACVVIQPLDHGTNQVIVKTREDLAEHIGHSEPKIVSDQNLAILARQLALHANVSSEFALPTCVEVSSVLKDECVKVENYNYTRHWTSVSKNYIYIRVESYSLYWSTQFSRALHT